MHEESQRLPVISGSRPGVVFMVPGFPDGEDDTNCLPAIQNYVAALAASRPDLALHVISFQYPYRRAEYLWKGATVHALGGANRRGLRRIPTWVRAARAFVRLRKQIDVVVLHTFWLTECTSVGQRLARMFGVRHVASVGGQDAKSSNRYLRRMDLNKLTITAGSAFAAGLLAARSGCPEVHVIPLGLDTRHLESIAPPPAEEFDVLGVGSLIPLKRYGTFLEVVDALRHELPDIRACIVGKGPEQEWLAREIKRRGLGRNVVLAGELPRDEVFCRMLQSRLLLHPSRYESQGYVFLEALFAGLHVVCFDVGYTGTSDRVHRCRSAPELISACRRLLREPTARVPQRVPTVEDTVRAFEAIYGL